MATQEPGVFISINSKMVKSTKDLPKPTPNSPKKLKKTLTKSVKNTHRASKKHIKRHFHAIVPAGVLAVVIGIIISANYFSSASAQADSFSARVFNPDVNITLDEVASTNVAKIIANNTDIIVAGNVNNLASNVEAKVKLSINEQSYVAKPQIVATESKTTDDIVEYVAKEGDTIDSIATKFSISADTVRWANDITGEIVAKGKKLQILPVDGLLYTIKAGDTAKSLASKYKADEEVIITFNDAEVSGLQDGSKIIIPDGVKPAPAPVITFATVAAVNANTYTGPTASSTPVYGGNNYVWGNCTWYVSNRRAEIGRPVPSNLGNAGSWGYMAAASGIPVNNSPAPGAVMVEGGYGLGHVSVVERVNPDGSILISEMNWGWALGVYHERTIPAGSVNNYQFIH